MDDFIYGIRAVIEAIEAGKQVDRVFIKKGLQGELSKELLTIVRDNDINTQFVPIEKLNRFTRKNHQGVVATMSLVEFSSIENIIPMLYEASKVPLILILDKVTDVRNFGGIARTAECAGVHAIVLPEKGSAAINADAVKTSAGALHNVPVCRVKNLVRTIEFLKDSGLQIIAATEKADEYYFEADFKPPTAIIMGAEDVGISSELLVRSDNFVKIPVKGKIASLNVSAAASVLLYESIRQRLLSKE